MSVSRDASLTIFITSMSGSKSLGSITNHFFHFRKPPDLRLAFAQLKGIETLVAFNASEVKKPQQRKEKERSIPLQKGSESQSRRRSHPNELSQNYQKRVVRWGGGGGRMVKEGQLVELVGDQSPSLEASPVAGEEGAIEMSREKQWRSVEVSGSLKGRRSEEITQSNTFSPWGSEVLLEFQMGDYN